MSYKCMCSLKYARMLPPCCIDWHTFIVRSNVGGHLLNKQTPSTASCIFQTGPQYIYMILLTSR